MIKPGKNSTLYEKYYLWGRHKPPQIHPGMVYIEVTGENNIMLHIFTNWIFFFLKYISNTERQGRKREK